MTATTEVIGTTPIGELGTWSGRENHVSRSWAVERRPDASKRVRVVRAGDAPISDRHP